MFIIQLSLGRNIGDQPMSDRDWRRFLNDAADTIRNQGETPELHLGSGVWGGVREESARITVYRDEAPTETYRAHLRAFLPVIAARYGQDAIGLVIAESELINRHK